MKQTSIQSTTDLCQNNMLLDNDPNPSNSISDSELPILVPIIWPTALDYWLGNSINKNSNNIVLADILNFKRISVPADFSLGISSPIAKRLIDSYGFLSPIAVAAPNPRKRNNGILFKSFVLSKELPPDSFIQINNFENVFVACPELCFIQAATFLSLHELVELACNLCATYVIDRTNELSQVRRSPITSVQKIKSFINESGKLFGKHKANMALQYATDNSNSPMESKLATIFRLPFSQGGYGLPCFEMNGKIILSREDRLSINKREICSDFVWKKEMLSVEYDSNMTHLEINQHFIDKHRANIITNAGYNLITLTYDNLKSLSALDRSVEQIRSHLNLRKSSSKYSQYVEERWTVANDLFRKHHSSYTEYFY